MYAPSKQGEQPSVEVSKEFMMSPNKLHLEASLDKEVSMMSMQCISVLIWINSYGLRNQTGTFDDFKHNFI